MYKNIKTIVGGLINQQQKKEYEQFIILKKRWEEKIDKKTKASAKIIDYKDNTITIQTKNSAWKNELNFMRTQIKKNFQQQS